MSPSSWGGVLKGALREGVRGKEMRICSIPSFADIRAISDPSGSKGGGPDGAGDSGCLLFPLAVHPG